MKKRFTILTVGVICAVSIAVGAVASAVVQQITAELRPDFEIVIDGEIRTFKDVNGEKVYPVLYEGTTYLPIRAIGEIMGKTVYWYEDDKRIELKSSTVTDADVILPGIPDSKPEQVKDKDKDKNKDKVKEDKKANGSDSAYTDEYIGVEAAKEIALEKAGLTEDEVLFEKAELDYDDGRAEYDIEFKQGKMEYSAEILATDGTIISWEADIDD